MTIKEIQEEIIDEFSMFEDWMERYEYIIDLGKSLAIIDDEFKKDENLIRGCQSKVWLHSELKNDTLYFTAESDAILTKGIVALLLRVFNEQTPADIIKADMTFIDQIELKEHLSPTRANGLVSMIKQIKLYALAFQTKVNS
ncbi:SufE family protein [Flavicella sp.]|uniref:SufE family protein n=1 Tax=Flavicella sp. TaxID=2957742 RepID=UPI003017C64F